MRPVAVAISELVELSLCVCFSQRILLLDFASYLFALSGHYKESIMGQYAPLFFHLPDELFPLASELVLVHIDYPRFATNLTTT